MYDSDKIRKRLRYGLTVAFPEHIESCPECGGVLLVRMFPGRLEVNCHSDVRYREGHHCKPAVWDPVIRRIWNWIESNH